MTRLWLLLALLAFPAQAQPSGMTLHTLTEPAPIPGDRGMVMGIYCLRPYNTCFAGALVSIPGTGNYQILRPFARWLADDETDLVDLSQSLKGVIREAGGLPKFILRFMEYGEEMLIDFNGYAAANDPGPITTRQLVTALLPWQLKATDWIGLLLYWPSNTGGPI